MTLVGTHGHGGITRRGDGRLQVSITMPNGRRIYRMVPAMPDKRAQRRRAEAVQRQLIEARDLDLDPSSQTVADYLRSWLDSMASAVYVRQRPRTLEFYEMVVERHIIPALGRIRLDRLSERHVQAWVDADPGAPRSVHHHRAVLRRALNVAVRKRIIGRNPALAIDLPEVDDEGGMPLTADEARRLIETTRDDRLGALWRLAIVTGMRQGELLGLAWDDVDFGGNDGTPAVHGREHGRRLHDRHGPSDGIASRVGVPGGDPRGRGPSITVRHQLAREGGQWVRREPKAARSVDRIAIDEGTAQALARHQRRQAEERRPDWQFWGLAFVTTKGQPWARSDILRAFHAACDAASVQRRRFHDLRHANATLLRELGVSEDVRQARLGHSTKDMARHYAKASITQDRDAVDRLAAVIEG